MCKYCENGEIFRKGKFEVVLVEGTDHGRNAYMDITTHIPNAPEDVWEDYETEEIPIEFFPFCQRKLNIKEA